MSIELANVAHLDRLSLDSDGAEIVRSAIGSDTLRMIREALFDQPADQAGIRLFGVEDLRPFLEPDGAIGKLAALRMKGSPRAVRAILFDKTPSTNWSLAWHQDRVIAVQDRIEVAGFGPWSRKHGALHVAPPFEVLSRMITLRVHLDPVPETNAPLLIAPGSHRRGRIAEHDVLAVVGECGVVSCLAAAGDAWLYATPILHASEAAAIPAHRRILQVDFAAEPLPGGLQWLDV
ncbi:phytanoyl-CoA dioxygenase family protein [Caulobacter sp. DWR1-3-2b1]|uniref:phytanoyl-CoA dioxygenase family protein n=1 Tax=Caulobacter sp. DWR1-3-2b1 TaxID=2804670 RepID=UPI003CF5A287